VNSPLWEKRWNEHLAKRETPAEEVDEFGKIFIDEIVEIVTEDGVVDLREPENIEAWVGPPYLKLKLDRDNCRVSAEFWTQKKDLSEKHLFDKVLEIDGDKADLGVIGSLGVKPAAECGSVVGRFLFSLRSMKDE